MSRIEPTYIEPSPAALGGPDPFGKRVVERVAKAQRQKDLMRDLFNDAYDYGFPTRPDFDSTSPGERRTDLIFDDTLVTAIPEFASELQSGLVPNQGQIARLMVGPSVPVEQRTEYQDVLDDITDFIHSKLRNSNFSEETHESFMDLSVSTLNMMMDIKGTLGDLCFDAIPLHVAVLDEGPDGKPDLKCKVHHIANKHIPGRWPKAEISAKQAKQIKQNPDVKVYVIEGIFRNWDNKNSEEYEYFVVNRENSETLLRKTTNGKGSSPWLCGRWAANSGEVWGRGLVLNVMPTVKSLNLVLQLIFENAQVAIGGIWQYDADGTINPDTIILEPGTFIPRAPGSRIDPLQSPTQFDVAQFVINDARAAIRQGLLVDALDQEGKTPVSAAQVGQEIGKFARRMGASFNRLLSEFVFEVFQRAVWLYSERGLIDIPKIDGQTIEIIAVSPLARAQDAQDITDFTRFIELSNFAFGEQTTQLALKPIDSMDWLADKTGVDKRLIKSQAEITRDLQNAAQAAQENPELAETVTNGITG